MHILRGALLFLCLFAIPAAYAQVGNKPDSTVRDYTSYDTTLPGNTFVDTVHHIAQDTTHYADKEKAKLAREKADADKKWIRTQIVNLSSKAMHGRGYVKGGRDTAAKYIMKKFKELKLSPVVKDGPMAQGFAFPVNTFPGKMFLALNGDSLVAGVDFLIDPASPGFTGDLKVAYIDLNQITDKDVWDQTVLKFDNEHAYFFEHVDSFCANVLEIKRSQFAARLPRGCFLIPEPGKLTWSVSRRTIPATILYIDDEILPKRVKKISVDVESRFLAHARSENIIGCVPGEVKDSFIVFTAHYDHLGMMGDTTYFPGASDNASGTATMLYLASYFAKHPQRYTVLFIAFAGEEAALMGSEFYTTHPFAPLGSIKFLVNIDIMGDATNGITVVNATKFPAAFEQLQAINEKGKYVPKINSRGPAANSDHYYFSEAGVPSFFIYSDGGKGNYHDVHDRPKELSLNHVDDFTRLMIDFVKELK